MEFLQKTQPKNTRKMIENACYVYRPNCSAYCRAADDTLSKRLIGKIRPKAFENQILRIFT